MTMPRREKSQQRRRRKDKREWGEKRRKKNRYFFIIFCVVAGLLCVVHRRRPLSSAPFAYHHNHHFSISLARSLYGAIMVKCSLVVVWDFEKIHALEPKKREMRKRRRREKMMMKIIISERIVVRLLSANLWWHVWQTSDTHTNSIFSLFQLLGWMMSNDKHTPPLPVQMCDKLTTGLDGRWDVSWRESDMKKKWNVQN